MSIEDTENFLDFVAQLEESIPRSPDSPPTPIKPIRDEITPDAIKRNAERYSRGLVAVKTHVSKDLSSRFFTSRVESPQNHEGCINPECRAPCGFIQDLPHAGYVVCTQCGAIQHTQIIQELQPFYWAYNTSHGTVSDLSTGVFRGGSSYQPKFHWNEDEKLRSLTAPRVPWFNVKVIHAKLRQMGYTPDQDIINPKLVIQKACRLIDQENQVHIYGRKWGEHWMGLVARFTRGRQSPPIQSDEEKIDFSTKFDWFCSAWTMCSHLLPGSRKDVERSQLPQFRWIFRQFLITFTPHQFDQWVRWLPTLSKNKEVELDLFWKRMCFVNGWHYIPVESFLKRIRDASRVKKRKKGLKGFKG